MADICPLNEGPDGAFAGGLGVGAAAAGLCGGGSVEGVGDGLGDGERVVFGETKAVGDDSTFGDEHATKSRATTADLTAF